MKRRWGLRVVKMIGIGVVAMIAIGYFVMLLWNALIPELFRGPVLTFWQAVGLLVLSHLLFRGWGHHGGRSWHRDRWSRRFEEKLAAMTPEEREKFQNEWRSWCGWTPHEQEPKQDG
ncbi:MAG TPA: hypothetical protein VK470_19800 [Bacteroidota bacterium]|nr:hypothetical protein [Bacteroidota bacterium]